jgi:hypothetical protein
MAQTALALATSTALALTSAIVIVIAIARDEHGLCQVRVLKAYHIRVLHGGKMSSNQAYSNNSGKSTKITYQRHAGTIQAYGCHTGHLL